MRHGRAILITLARRLLAFLSRLRANTTVGPQLWKMIAEVKRPVQCSYNEYPPWMFTIIHTSFLALPVAVVVGLLATGHGERPTDLWARVALAFTTATVGLGFACAHGYAFWHLTTALEIPLDFLTILAAAVGAAALPPGGQFLDICVWYFAFAVVYLLAATRLRVSYVYPQKIAKLLGLHEIAKIDPRAAVGENTVALAKNVSFAEMAIAACFIVLGVLQMFGILPALVIAIIAFCLPMWTLFR